MFAPPTPVLKVKLLDPKAKLPTRAHSTDAGLDLYSIENIVVPSWGKAEVKTGIAVDLPENTYGQVSTKSGLCKKFNLTAEAGIIDQSYRGEIIVFIFNHSDKDYEFKQGDKVAQLIVIRIHCPEVIQVQELDETERGVAGFGSTDNKTEATPAKTTKNAKGPDMGNMLSSLFGMIGGLSDPNKQKESLNNMLGMVSQMTQSEIDEHGENEDEAHTNPDEVD